MVAKYNSKTSKLILIALMSIFNQSIYSQVINSPNNVFPPSPDASALLEYVNVPVDYYTGVPDINVPLFTLPGRDIAIPIGVSYHASGVKVQDVASSVGLSWNLYAGGAITRIARGVPDGNTFNCGIDLNNSMYWGSFLSNNCDHESDIFYFNFIGQTGKFFLDENLVPFQVPVGYSKIQPLLNGNAVTSVPIRNEAPTVVGSTLPESKWAWKITDENGYQYFFGEDAGSTETSTPTGSATSNARNFISTWYLTRIISPTGIQIATFSYTTGGSTTIPYYSSIRKDIVKTSGSCQNVASVTITPTNTSIIIQDPKYLSTISTSLGSVNFEFIDGRRDNSGKYLKKVTIRDLNSVQLKSYSFEYGYFTGVKSRISNDPFTPLGCNSAECVLRLKLNSIVDDSQVKIREFVYNEDIDLPQRSSNYIDHWGYYNYTSSNYPTAENDAQTRIPRLDFTNPNLPINGSSSAGLGVFAGARKFSEPYMAQANILTQIKYPTGGFTLFEYEGNQTPDGLGGGLRIKSIKDYNAPNSLVGNRTYTYEQGKKYSDPVYHYLVVGGDLGVDCFDPFGLICWNAGCGITSLVRSSGSLNDLFDLNGVGVGYGKVTEVLTDNSKIERTYTNFDTRPDTEPTIKIYLGKFSTYLEISIPTNSYGPPFSPKTSSFWERSLLLSEKLFDSDLKLLQETQYNYDFSLSNTKQILCKSVESTSQTTARSSSDQKNIVRVGTYYINVRPINLLNVTNTLYGQSPINASNPVAYPSVTSTSIINKHPTYQGYVQSIINTLPDGSQTKIEYKYVFDLTNNISVLRAADPQSLGLWQMLTNNIISEPIEVISYYRKPGVSEVFKVTGASLSTFVRHPSLYITFPYETYELQLESPVTDFHPASIINLPDGILTKDGRYKLVTRLTYDNTNLTLSRQDSNSGIATTYDWGFNNTLLTAAYINPGANQLNTEYFNKPMVGLTSIKDANLQTVNYEFDKFHRLKIIKDTDGNIVQRYKYHYQNQVEFLADFATNGGLFVNNSISFTSLIDLEPLGNTSYTWDFGDGQVVQNTTKSIAHTYTSAGTYSVKLLKSNPEYGNLIATKSIVVVPPPTITISSNNTNIDLCSGSTSAQMFANAIGGCSSFTYNWYSKSVGVGYWTFNGNGESFDFSSGIGSYDVKCEVTDGCGQISISNIINVTITESTPGCDIR